MMKRIKFISILLLGLFLIPTSCTKDFEEINTDPNNPVDAPSINIMVNVIRFHTQQFYNAWGDMNEPSSWANHLGKIQYIDEAQYKFREGVVNNLWTATYTNIADLNLIIEKESKEGGNPNYLAMAKTLRAYIFHIATDRWKDIPYTEAAIGNTGNIQPAYDTQESIYTNILNELKAANDLYSVLPANAIGANDVLLGGSVDKWKRFTNSLRLRAATRISNIAPALAQTHIEEILSNQATYPVIVNNSDNVYLYWQPGGAFREPWALDAVNRDDHGMCNTLIDVLAANNDPRLPVYAKPATFDNAFRGVVSGAVDGTFELSHISRIGARFRDVPDGFTPLFRAAEVHFMIAEAATRSWNTGGVTAQQAYEAGVSASLAENGVGASYDAFIAEPGVAWNADVNRIHFQKWIALFKNGNEAWAENRRTDIPLLSHAPGSPYSGHNRPPFRYPYPTNEINLNLDNLTPKLVGIQDHMWGQKMWWDTRTGVN